MTMPPLPAQGSTDWYGWASAAHAAAAAVTTGRLSDAELRAALVTVVGSAASPISDPNVARPTGAAVVLFMMAAGVTPANAVNGDLIWNA